MHTFLAFLPRPEGGTIKVSREWVEASDWFVLFTLGTLLFLLGSFATWAWLIWRRTTKPEPHIKLLMELEEESAVEARTTMSEAEPETPPPWAQTPDWWKKVDP
ncbi:MAG: hypothetical protein ACYC67_13395 [Prosthecobacter sp.]|jgi:hypothetical protein